MSDYDGWNNEEDPLSEMVLTEEQILQLCEEGEVDDLEQLAMRRDLNLQAQLLIARSDSRWGKVELAWNDRTYKAALLTLLEDPNEEIRCTAMGNGQLTLLDLEPFKDGSDAEKRARSENLNVNMDVARLLVTDKIEGNRIALVNSRRLTPWMSDQLSYDPSDAVLVNLNWSKFAHFSEDASVRFLHENRKDLFEALTVGCDQETIKSLAPTWTGSVETLKEAALLTLRGGS